MMIFFLNSREARSGLDKYSYLDKIDNWTIERKIDSANKTVFCRASIFTNGTWFGSRIRLDRNDDILFPTKKIKQEINVPTL